MRRAFIAGCVLAFAVSTRAGAQTYKVVVPQLSPSTIEVYKNLASAILEGSGAKFTIEVMPFAKAIDAVEKKEADLLVSAVGNPDSAKAAALKFDYSTADLFSLVFVAYSNKGKPVDPADIKNGNPKNLVIETDIAHAEFFPFRAVGSTSMDASLKKVDGGKIDAFIFAQPSSDATLKRLGLKNVTRQYYESFRAKAILQKGARGRALDKLLTSGLEKAMASGKYKQVMEKYLEGAAKYQEWQP